MDPHFLSAHLIRTPTTVPLREFQENLKVRKKLRPKNPFSISQRRPKWYILYISQLLRAF
jgi:hypothetical protein